MDCFLSLSDSFAMSEVADEIAYLKALLEESRATIKDLRMEVAELKLILGFNGIAIAPPLGVAHPSIGKALEISGN